MNLVLLTRIVDPSYMLLCELVYTGHLGSIIDMTTGEIVADKDNPLTRNKLSVLYDNRCYRGHKIVYEHYVDTSEKKEAPVKPEVSRGYKKYSKGKRVW